MPTFDWVSEEITYSNFPHLKRDSHFEKSILKPTKYYHAADSPVPEPPAYIEGDGE